MLKALLSSAGLAAMVLAAPAAQAESSEFSMVSTATAVAPMDPAFEIFAPRDRLSADKIDYTAWSEAMNYIVFPMARSLRERERRPDPNLGSRRLYGHKSPYRLEGNRVMFSFFTPELQQMVSDYRLELQELASKLDIASLPRNEQLSYWINLHNVALIEKIASEWPIRQPREIEIDGVPLDQARFLMVRGVAMSPHDIRHQIVYRHWEDPKVIYGFWRGDIGGPSIASDAFNSLNVSQQLERNAREFVNSLRGTQKRGELLQVSAIYDEARPYFFSDWPTDLRAHLAEYADDEVAELIAGTTGTEAVLYEADIADLAGGVREPTYSLITATDRDGNQVPQSFRIPPGTARLLTEEQRKVQKLREELRTGRVIIRPITLPGDQATPPEVD